jgi:putative aldouronate transport system substrate-binding protein
MLLTGLVSCNSPANTVTTNAPTASVPESTEATTSEPTQTPQSLLPYSGESIVYKGFTMDFFVNSNPDNESKPIVQAYRKMCGNVRIDWDCLPLDDFQQKLKIYFSSGEMPDIVLTNDATNLLSQYSSSGIFLDLNQYIDYMPDFQPFTQQLPYIDFFTVNENGNRYSLPMINTTDYVGYGFIANKTVLDRLNISIPETVDEFYEAMVQIKQADPSIIPFQALDYSQMSISFKYMFGCSSSIYYDQASQTWIYQPTMNDNYKQALEFMEKCYRNNLFDPEISTIAQDQGQAKLAAGNWAFTWHYYTSPETSWWKNNLSEMPDLVPMLAPSYNGKSYALIIGSYNTQPWFAYFASAKVKNPELLTSLMNLWFTEDVINLRTWGIEGLTYSVSDNGKKTFIKEIENGTISMSTIFGSFTDGLLGPSAPYGSADVSFGLYPFLREGSTFICNAIRSGQAQIFLSDYPRPKFTEEQAEEISRIVSDLDTYTSENEMEFVTGRQSFDDWDSFISGYTNIGDIGKVLGYYNSAPQFPSVTPSIPDPSLFYGE